MKVCSTILNQQSYNDSILFIHTNFKRYLHIGLYIYVIYMLQLNNIGGIEDDPDSRMMTTGLRETWNFIMM